MSEDERRYYERRLTEETARANATSSGAAQAAHRGMAERYLSLLSSQSDRLPAQTLVAAA